jgi:phage gp36-like protein
MGRYIAWTDVSGRYPAAAKKGGDSEVGSYWLTYAEDEVDARLSLAYTTPFSPAPGVVKDLCIDLTYYKMFMFDESVAPLKEYLDDRFMGLLNGTISITTSGTAANAISWSEHENYHSSFGPDDPVNWNVSSQWAQDADDSRDL